MRSVGQALIQQHWHFYKKRESGHRHSQSEDNMKTQGKIALKGILESMRKKIYIKTPGMHLNLYLGRKGIHTNTQKTQMNKIKILKTQKQNDRNYKDKRRMIYWPYTHTFKF